MQNFQVQWQDNSGQVRHTNVFASSFEDAVRCAGVGAFQPVQVRDGEDWATSEIVFPRPSDVTGG